MRELRPWNVRKGDQFTILDAISIPARTLTFEATSDPIADWNRFSGERVWTIPRKLVGTSDGKPCVYPGEVSRVYSDERVAVTNR